MDFIKSLLYDIAQEMESLEMLNDEYYSDGLFEYIHDIDPTIEGEDIANAIDEVLKEVK